MRKMSHLQAAEGTEMSHPGPPGKMDWWPQLLEVRVSGQPFKECLGCSYLAQSSAHPGSSHPTTA